MKNIKRIILISLIICNCATIFFFSSQEADESNSTSGTFVNAIIDTLYKNKNYTNQEEIKIRDIITTIVRKGAHFSIYMCLGILTFLFFSTYQINTKRNFVYAIIFCCIYACTDEFHQLFVSGRSGEFRDVCIDTSGSLLGSAISYCILKVFRKNKKISSIQ